MRGKGDSRETQKKAASGCQSHNHRKHRKQTPHRVCPCLLTSNANFTTILGKEVVAPLKFYSIRTRRLTTSPEGELRSGLRASALDYTHAALSDKRRLINVNEED